MLDRMRRLQRAVSRHWKQNSSEIDARSLRASSLKLMVEGLEGRVVPATITWANPGSGGIWELGSNWSGGKVPTAADDVVINLTAASTVSFTRPGDVALSITTNNNSALQINNGGTFQLGAGSSSLGANLTIVPGASMTIAPKATLAVNNAEILDQGTLTLGAGDAVTMTGTQMNPGVFVVTGIMTATSDTITGGNYTGVDVFSGGELIATSDTFAAAGVFFDSSAVLKSTDLTANDFTNTVFSIPAIEVPLVTNNRQFGEVDALGSLASGKSLELTAMGTVSASTLYYRFVEDFEVSAGATLSFDANLKVVFDVLTTSGLEGTTLDDNGSVIFNQGDSVSLYTLNPIANNPEGQIVVNGTLNATGTSFNNVPTMPTPSDFTQIVVRPAGHLIGTNDGFSVSNVYFNPGSILNAGDLTNSDFSRTVLTLPATYVPQITNNKQFTEVDLLPGALAPGQNLELTAMGTVSAANLFYVFLINSSTKGTGTSSDFTINAGATLTIDPGLRVNLFSFDPLAPYKAVVGSTITDNGTLNFGQGDLVTLDTTAPTTSQTYPPAEIIVGNGGVMTATGSSFLNQAGSGFTEILVNSGGHLTGSNNFFAPSLTSLADGSILNAGDLTGNFFSNTVLSLPAIDVPLVTNNKQFSEVDLLPGTLASGVNLPLTAMGTVLTSTLFYRFVGNYTISPGASITVDPNLQVLGNGSTLTDDGTLNFGRGDTTSLSFAVGSTPTGGMPTGGLLNAPGTTFNSNQIVVNSGGNFTEVGDQINTGNLTLGPGSAASLTISSFTATLTVDSSATININGDNFNNLNVVATGDPNAHINLTGNYWGTTDTAAIEAKIHDHHVDAKLPTVDFLPDIAGVASIFASNATAPYSSAAQNVTLTASIVGVTGTINEGTVTFGVYSGNTLIGSVQTVPEANGTASATYALPAGISAGSYAIQAQYSGDANYLPAIDTSHVLTITQAPTTVAGPAAPASTTYNAGNPENATLHATVTSGVGGAINEGTATFTVLNGTTTIGTPVTVNVVNGSIDGTYSLPAGTPGATYTVQVVFNGSTNYAASSAGSFPLTVNPAPSTVAATAGSTTFSTASQTVTLTASVTSAGGAVNEGAVTFTLLNGTTAVGSPQTANVANGTASVTYTLPAGAGAGSYAISAAYNGTADFAASTDASQNLAVGKATSKTTAVSATAGYDTDGQSIKLTANVASGSTQVNEGTLTFKVLSGSTLIGTVASGNVVGGVATASYPIPGGLPLRSTYTIEADYNGSGDYQGSTDSSSGTLTIVQATPAVAASTDVGVFNAQSESIAVHATVLNNGVTGVNDGSVTFQAFNGSTPVGSPVTATLSNGVANATITLPGGTPVGTSDTILASYGGTVDYAAGSASSTITLNKATPVITFPTPANLVYGQALSGTQLAATASVAGQLTYTPASGTVLNAGSRQTLTAAFTPADANDYNPASVSVPINVAQAVPSFGGMSASQTVAFGQPGITVSGRLAASTAVPAGSVVAIVISSPSMAVASTAIVNRDGTFSQVVGVSGLAVGSYTIKYGFLGTPNFSTAFDGSTQLTVIKANQTLTTFNPPPSAVYGTTFHVSVVNDSGLPVSLVATNAIVKPSNMGGFDVTLTSGSNNAVLTASAPGDANRNPIAGQSITVAAVKAQATVSLADLGVFFDGQAHTVSASTNPAGLNVAVAYTLNGAAVTAPTLAGAYVATATIQDPNYQGTATSRVVIVAPVTTGASGNPFVGPVAVEYIQVGTGKGKVVTSLSLVFSGPLQTASAQNLANYRLATAGTRGSYDAKNARTIALRGASYNPVTHTVTLTIAKPFKVTQPVQIRAYSNPSRGLVDAQGRLIDGSHTGAFGGDENAILNKNLLVF